MPISDFDPRVFFAAERTLLAWVRTGLTVMGFGFIIARFGLFLQFIALQTAGGMHHSEHGLSALIGIFFVAAGALAVLVATVQHRRFTATLPAVDRPLSYSTGFGIVFGAFIAVLGFCLAGYLAIS
jgi:putative membrane protein